MNNNLKQDIFNKEFSKICKSIISKGLKIKDRRFWINFKINEDNLPSFEISFFHEDGNATNTFYAYVSLEDTIKNANLSLEAIKKNSLTEFKNIGRHDL